MGPSAHDEFELLNADLSFLVTKPDHGIRGHHHVVNDLVVEALGVHAPDVRPHFGGIDAAALVRVHGGKHRLQPRIRLVDALAKDGLEPRSHARLLEPCGHEGACGLGTVDRGRTDDLGALKALLAHKGGAIHRGRADSLGAIHRGRAGLGNVRATTQGRGEIGANLAAAHGPSADGLDADSNCLDAVERGGSDGLGTAHGRRTDGLDALNGLLDDLLAPESL